MAGRAARRLSGGQPGHSGTQKSRLLGYRTFGSKRGIYGWEIRCSCGWTAKTNEDHRRAWALWDQHLQGVGSSRIGFGPARVQ